MSSSVDWSALRKHLHGELITPDQKVYEAARQPFNARIDRKPVAVARAICEHDVVACVKFCVANGVRMTARSGSHGAEGYCCMDNELMIDLSALQTIRMDLEKKVVHVAGGCFWGQVDIATYPRSLASCGGGCAEVGVGGLAQGGGFGPIARTHGLTVDNMIRARIVTSRDQKVIIADKDSEPDLYWALRGGGGGNFGIVTEFTFQLHDIGRAFMGGSIVYNWGADTKKVFQVYRDWMRSTDADERLTFLPIFAFDDSGTPLCILSTFYNGDAQKGLDYIQAIFKQYGMPTPAGPPVAQALTAMTLPAYTGTESTTAWPGSGQYWKSGFLENDFPDAAIDTFMEWFAKAPQSTNRPSSVGDPTPLQKVPDLSFGFIESLGGAIGRVGKTDTGFFWRDQLFSFSFIGIYTPGDDKWQKATAEWTTSFRAAMEPYFAGGVYVNYMQDDLKNWKQAYYGDNYPRLRKIKETYDPGHFFAFPQDLMQDQ